MLFPYQIQNDSLFKTKKMKTNIKYILLFPVLLLLSCEDKTALFADDVNRINFSTASIITPYSFAYGPVDRMQDTVFVNVSTIGFVTNAPRKISLQQLPFNDGRAEAVAGVHYVDFNDPSIADKYVIPAGKNNALLPILVKRDISLKTQEVTLRIALSVNENFSPGLQSNQTKTITMSDFLSKPTNWDLYGEIVTYFGAYGKVKYQFMIDAVAPLGYIVDNDFLILIKGGLSSDPGQREYWRGFFKEKLAAVNAERAKQGLGLLREAPLTGQLEGNLVTFP